MKKTVLLALISVFALQMKAQVNEPGKFYINLKAGYNMANITLLDEFGADPRHALNVGISGEYAVNERIAIEPGIFYSLQGSVFNISTVNLHLNSDYLVVPLYLKAYAAKGFNLFAGPQFSYLARSRIFVKTGEKWVDGILSIVSNNIDLTKYENNYDVAIVLGLGYQTPFGFNISANYNIGLMNVPDLPDFTLGDKTFTLNPIAKNRVFQLNIGYRF